MRLNRLRRPWDREQALPCGRLATPNALLAEAVIHQGWNGLAIDLQRGLIDCQAPLQKPSPRSGACRISRDL